MSKLETELTSAGQGVPPLETASTAKTNGSGGAAAEAEGGSKAAAAAPAGDEPPTPTDPEDYWSPLQHVPAGHLMQDVHGDISPVPAHDGTECLKWDPSLWSHADHFKYRWHIFRSIRDAIDTNEGGLDKFTQGYKYFGINRGERDGRPGLWYREWAPGAKALALIGEFNGWKAGPEHWAVKNDYGVWELFLADDEDGTPAILHRTKIKARLETAYGEWVERIPAWSKWATQEWNEIQYNGVHYEPAEAAAPGVYEEGKAYTFKYDRPERPRDLRIYECHVGMSSKDPKVNSYTEFKDEVLPRIRRAELFFF